MNDENSNNSPQEEVFDEVSSRLPGMDVPSITFPCIQDALIWLSMGRELKLDGTMTKPPAFLQPIKLLEAKNLQVMNYFIILSEVIRCYFIFTHCNFDIRNTKILLKYVYK